jgi:hypothetical protein
MIPSNGVLVGEYWELLLVLLSEQRQVAGREPLSEQRSAGRPGYSGESQLHLLRHRAPITATRPTGTATLPMDIPPIGTLLTDIRVTGSRAMVTPDIRDTPLILLPQDMDTQATRGTPLILDPQAMDTQARRGIQAIRHLDTKAARHTLPIQVPVIDTRCTAILAIEPPRTGCLGSSMPSSLLAEFRPKIHPHRRPHSLVRGERLP